MKIVEPILQIRNLTQKYALGEEEGKFIVPLKDINLKIYEGDYAVIFGPSGAGKSTLLHLIAGLEKPTEGEIDFRGRNISRLNDKALSRYRRQKIGMIFQSFNLIPTLTVLENVALPATIKGTSLQNRNKKALELLEELHIRELLGDLPTELSGGEQQRVAIARALINSPSLLLVDEPTGNLDSKNADQVMEILEKLNKKEKRTIILVTHNSQYLHHADRVFFLEDGKIVDDRRKYQKIKMPSRSETEAKHLEKIKR